MTTQPTPSEAADALHNVSRQQQGAVRKSNPAWALWLMAGLVLLVGIGSDLRPEWSTALSYVLVATGLLLSYAPRFKRVGAALGFQSSPSARQLATPPGYRSLNILVLALMILAAIGVPMLLRHFAVPFSATIGSVLIVATMPLWHRFFTRAAQVR